MRRLIQIFNLLLMLFAISSCEKVLEIDDNPEDAGLVLNAIAKPGKQANLYFARTRFFLDPSNDQPVPVESMQLRANGNLLTLDSTVRCRYYFDYTLAEGDSLEISILSQGRRVTATTYVPYQPTFTDLHLQAVSDTTTFRLLRAQFKFKDHADIREYYRLSVNVRDSGERYNEWKRQLDTVDTVHSNYFMLFNCPDITSSDVSYTRNFLGLYTRNFFHDGRMDGQLVPVDLGILILRDTNERPGFKHEYTVSLESLTFERLRYLIDMTRQNSTNSFFAEQGSVRGNVDGAFGLFSGAAREEFTFWPDTLVSDDGLISCQSFPQPNKIIREFLEKNQRIRR